MIRRDLPLMNRFTLVNSLKRKNKTFHQIMQINALFRLLILQKKKLFCLSLTFTKFPLSMLPTANESLYLYEYLTLVEMPTNCPAYNHVSKCKT